MGNAANVYVCLDNTIISAFFLCDGRLDCITQDDEEMCGDQVLPAPIEICNNLLPNNKAALPNVCFNPNAITHMEIGIRCRPQLSDLDQLVIDSIAQETITHNGTSNDMKVSCIFELDDCGNVKGYSNGQHLINCESFICDGAYYKCPESYCIPWRYICNGKVDCPGGVEEISCKIEQCPGFFKCLNSTYSSICVSTLNVCDGFGFADCPNGDDEYYCSNKLQVCPDECECRLLPHYWQIAIKQYNASTG